MKAWVMIVADLLLRASKPAWVRWTLVAAWLVCVAVSFESLHYLTPMPLWACVMVAFPVGVLLFCMCIVMAEG
jgi:hypothetical protein